MTFVRRPLNQDGYWNIVIGLAISCLCLQAEFVRAADVKLLSSYSMRPILDEVAPQFDKAGEHRVRKSFANTKGILKRVRRGEALDVVFANQDGINELVKNGKADSANVTVILKSGIGVAIRKGATKPDIATPDALRRTLLAARSITYNNPTYGATSGTYFTKVLERLGIVNEVQSKTIFSTNDAGLLVAHGKAELGISQMSSLMRFKGIEIVGPLPGELQSNVVYSAAILNGAKNAEAAKSLINFLRRPEAAMVYRSKGMEPG